MQSYRSVIALGLLALWVASLYNNVSNRHYHFIEDGKIISHAHPFSSDNNHSHTDEEMAWLDVISNIQVTDSFFAIRLTSIFDYQPDTISFSYNSHFYRSVFTGIKPLRGPPVFA